MKIMLSPLLCLFAAIGIGHGQANWTASLDTLGVGFLYEGAEGQDEEQAFCTPGILNKSRSRGVDIAYNFLNGGTLRPAEAGAGSRPGEMSYLETIIFKIKVPLINKPGFKLLLGYTYQPELYTFSRLPTDQTFSIAGPNFSDVFNEVNDRRLKHNSYNLYAMKPLDRTRYLAFRFSAAFNGDYTGWMNFDDRYGVYRATAAYGIKKSKDLEYGFGLALSHNFRRTLVLPFFIYNRNFNEKWGLETVFPAYVNGRYNVNPRTILLFGYQVSGVNYSIDIRNSTTGQDQIYHLGRNEIMVGASLERQVVPWVWVNLKAGFQFNLPTRFRATVDGASSYSVVPTNMPYLRTGIFISPPDRLRR